MADTKKKSTPKRSAPKRSAPKRSAAKRSTAKRPAAVTPQVDRSRPTKSESAPAENQVEDSGQKAEALEYKPRHLTPQMAGVNQHEVEAKRQAELTAARDEHNRRTGDASR